MVAWLRSGYENDLGLAGTDERVGDASSNRIVLPLWYAGRPISEHPEPTGMDMMPR